MTSLLVVRPTMYIEYGHPPGTSNGILDFFARVRSSTISGQVSHRAGSRTRTVHFLAGGPRTGSYNRRSEPLARQVSEVEALEYYEARRSKHITMLKGCAKTSRRMAPSTSCLRQSLISTGLTYLRNDHQDLLSHQNRTTNHVHSLPCYCTVSCFVWPSAISL